MNQLPARSLMLAATLALIGACDAKRPPAPAQPINPDSPDARHKSVEIRPGIWRYTTRGEIARLPGKAGLSQDMAIHHEALADFHSSDGSNPGMPSMEMDFPSIAPGVSLEGLAVGDAIVFDFDVDWASRDVWTVTRIAKLPAGTPLTFDAPPHQDSADAPSK